MLTWENESYLNSSYFYTGSDYTMAGNLHGVAWEEGGIYKVYLPEIYGIAITYPTESEMEVDIRALALLYDQV